MKISSLKNEFDQFDQDFEIDETTICADLGIDPQKIADNVLQTIAEPTVKKNRRRFITVFVAAAALSITAVCSTVIATSGVLRPDFTDVYQGDISALEIRGTETFEFAPLDQNLQAEFIGIVNTEDRIVASVNISKKDGTPFTSSDGIQNPSGFLLEKLLPEVKNNENHSQRPTDYSVRLKEQQYGFDYPYVFYVEDENGNICEQSADAVEYVLSDNGKTLRMFITAKTVDKDLTGGYVYITSRYTKAYQYDKKLKAFNTLDETTYADAKYFCQIDGCDMDKDCKWKISSGQYALYTIKTERLALPFDMHFKIDYQLPDKIEKTLDNSNAPQLIRQGDQAQMTISPTKITLSSHKTLTTDEINQMQSVSPAFREEDKMTEENPTISIPECVSAFSVSKADSLQSYDDIDYENSKLLMTDGSVLYFILTDADLQYEAAPDSSVTVKEARTITYSSHFVNKKLNSINADEVLRIFRTTVIDPEKIAKVIINGDLIYAKTGYEDMTVPAPETYTEYTPEDFAEESIAESSDDKNYLPDMTKYEPLEKTSNEMRYILQQYTQEHSLLLTSVNTDINTRSKDDPSIAINRAVFTAEGATENLRHFLQHLLKEEQHNLFIISASLSSNQDENGSRELTVTIENPFVADDAYKSEQDVYSFVIARWGTLQRSLPIEHFFETETDMEKPYLKLTMQQTDFSKQDHSSYSDIRIDPNHKPTQALTLANYQFKQWTDEELNILNSRHGTNGSTPVILHDVNDKDNTAFCSNSLELIISGTQAKILKTVQYLQEYETKNLFITSVFIFHRDNLHSEYHLKLTLANPYPLRAALLNEQQRDTYIQSHYGAVEWNKMLSTYFSAIENDSISAEFTIASNRKTDAPVVKADIWANFATYDDIAAYKDTINRNPYFTVTNSMNVQRIYSLPPQEDYLSANFTLTTTYFIRSS